MQALAALAFTLPPSLAFVVWAWLRLLRERDRKVAQEYMQLADSTCDSLAEARQTLERMDKRLTEAETHIGQLTDRSLR